MIDTEYLDDAKRIKKNNDIEAPINDIVDCLSNVKHTGVDNECAEKMVISMFNNEKHRKYRNTNRTPEDKEILVYNISDNLLDIISNPE